MKIRYMKWIGAVLTALVVAGWVVSFLWSVWFAVGSVSVYLGESGIGVGPLRYYERLTAFYRGWPDGWEWMVLMPRFQRTGPVWVLIPFIWLLPLVYIPTMYLWDRDLTARRRTRLGQCLKCGYDLSGNVSGVCPECGEPIAGRCRAPGPAERGC